MCCHRADTAVTPPLPVYFSSAGELGRTSSSDEFSHAGRGVGHDLEAAALASPSHTAATAAAAVGEESGYTSADEHGCGPNDSSFSTAGGSWSPGQEQQQQPINAGIYSDEEDGGDGFGSPLSFTGRDSTSVNRPLGSGGATEAIEERGGVRGGKRNRGGGGGAGYSAAAAAASPWGTSVDYWSGDSESEEDNDEDRGEVRRIGCGFSLALLICDACVQKFVIDPVRCHSRLCCCALLPFNPSLFLLWAGWGLGSTRRASVQRS